MQTWVLFQLKHNALSILCLSLPPLPHPSLFLSLPFFLSCSLSLALSCYSSLLSLSGFQHLLPHTLALLGEESVPPPSCSAHSPPSHGPFFFSFYLFLFLSVYIAFAFTLFFLPVFFPHFVHCLLNLFLSCNSSALLHWHPFLLSVSLCSFSFTPPLLFSVINNFPLSLLLFVMVSVL